MHEWAVFGFVAAGFYLLECCAWISRPCLACFRHPFTGRWRPALAADLVGNDRGGLLMASPVSFSGAVLQSCEWPFIVDPDGLLNVAFDDRDDQEPAYIAFTEIETIRPVLESVLINEGLVIRTPSAVAAAECAALLENLTSARRRDREKLIQSAIADRVNTGKIIERLKWFHAETRTLRLASMLAAAWLFAVSPIVLFLVGPLASWPFLLAGLFLCGIVTATVCFRAHQRLFHAAAADRWTHVLSMVFFPLAAFRACDRLSKDLMWRFEPIALVAALCEPRTYAGAIRPIVFDLTRSRTWHHDLLRNQVSQMLEAVDCDPLIAPDREDASMAAFCPRCHTQYSEGRAACGACAAVPLEPFAAVVERVSNSTA
jgi:hypothetical protein